MGGVIFLILGFVILSIGVILFFDVGIILGKRKVDRERDDKEQMEYLDNLYNKKKGDTL